MALPITTLTVNDGATTPVAQTFAVSDRTGLTSTLRNGAAALVRGMHILFHEIRLAKTPKAANRALINLQTPTEATVDGQTTVIRSSLFKLEANFSPDSPEIERQTHFGLFLNAVNHADVKASIIKLQSLS